MKLKILSILILFLISSFLIEPAFANTMGKIGYDLPDYINKKGEIIKPTRKQIELYENSEQSKFSKNNFTKASDKEEFKDKLIVVKISNKWGYANKDGKIIIEPNFDFACVFSEGLASVNKEGKWGYIEDKTGKFIIKPQFRFANNFSEGLAAVLILNNWGYINKTGKVVIKPEFYEAGQFHNGIAKVRSTQKSHFKPIKLPFAPFGILAGITAWAGVSVRKKITKEKMRES